MRQTAKINHHFPPILVRVAQLTLLCICPDSFPRDEVALFSQQPMSSRPKPRANTLAMIDYA